jgi:hypothetical protein
MNSRFQPKRLRRLQQRCRLPLAFSAVETKATFS